MFSFCFIIKRGNILFVFSTKLALAFFSNPAAATTATANLKCKCFFL